MQKQLLIALALATAFANPASAAAKLRHRKR